MLKQLKALLGLSPRVQPAVVYLPTIREAEARRRAALARPSPRRRD
jgi:uncharacterized Zn finger protein